MHLLTLGLNHQTAPLALRERVAFVPEEIGGTIARMRERLSDASRGRLSEAAIVSTCNRTELYCAVEQPHAAGPALADFVAEEKRLDTDEFRRSA
jgi:glutamyl-tRNA reductase